MSYVTMDHAAWVEENNRAANQIYARQRNYKVRPETLTPFQARVMDICGMVGNGIYNAPIDWDRIDWGTGNRYSGMFVPWRDRHMSTFDYYPLTLLVLLCHEARIRCEISARSAGRLTLSFFQRGHAGNMMQRHPNIDEAVAAFRDYLPANHRIIYHEDEQNSADPVSSDMAEIGGAQ